jgi:catechol 2,3-dioxygenase-like lactoylglutathione lyase family enzyme
MQLQRAMIFVKDLEGMAAFYGDALGLVPIAETRTTSWVEFETGGGRLALHGIPPEIAGDIKVTSTPLAREDNPIKLVFAVDDVEREHARLVALGVSMMRRPWGASDGVDPEGNIFQICPEL